jgi:hypothetical protein
VSPKSLNSWQRAGYEISYERIGHERWAMADGGTRLEAGVTLVQGNAFRDAGPPTDPPQRVQRSALLRRPAGAFGPPG